ncbi:phosphatase PAP2 family protein [Paenibacillus thermotolerans]|uniref:phosphatase PAP2 family protein n=1 Tax=Paenibacillus thermotolerans TaxID=3027807 RepID=UPI002368B951|nr:MULTISPECIES: phosphatase PAP2 family protein [unclassified Paenibacillus]
MSRVFTWLKAKDQRVFLLFNHKINHAVLGFFLARLTHLGGATATIAASLCIWWFAPLPWSKIGLQAVVALALSHIPVAVMKKLYPRLRPYLVLPETITCDKPLKDHSFPSGHTTAIFSVVSPFVVAAPVLGFVLVPLAMIVGISRMYLGLHYPSDVAAGCVVGCLTAFGTVAVLG